MSILYNRLKSVEKERKPDVQLDKEEEFPIDGEIKRQKEERRRKTRMGMIFGALIFCVSLLVWFEIIPMVQKNKKIIMPLFKRQQINKSVAPQQPAVSPEPVPNATSQTGKTPPQKTGTNSAKVAETQKPAAELESAPKTTAAPIAQVEPVIEHEVDIQSKENMPSEDLFEYGIKLYKQNKYPEAVDAYVKGLKDYPQQAVGYNNLGAIYYQQGKLEKASEQLKMAVELNPQYAEAHFNLAVVLEKLGQNNAALIHYLKFLELNSPKDQALQEKVKAYVRYYY